MLAALTPADIAAALQRVFAGSAPVLFRAAQSGPVGTPALAAALIADQNAALATRAQAAAVVWPYTTFGTPGVVLARSDDAALGTTTVRFANGARLMVKPTTFEKDHVSVKVLLGNGRAGADAARVHALWATSLAPLGGTAKLAAGDIERWAQSGGRTLAVEFKADTRFFTLGGQTRPADFVAEMQVLAAEARDPGFRPELGEKLAALAPMISGQVDANAGAVFGRALHSLQTGGDMRYVDVPSAADIAATRADDVPALLKPALAGPADVVVVGDVTVDAAISAMQATFAAGPMMS